jgi:hypothetical protein
LTSHEVVINLIANTKTKGGLRIRAGLDNGQYKTGEKVSNEELERIKVNRNRLKSAIHHQRRWLYTDFMATPPQFLQEKEYRHSRQYMTTAIGGGFLSFTKTGEISWRLELFYFI